MLFLLLAILSSSVLAIVLKYLSTDNTYGVYFVNYCTCALLAFLFLEPKSLWNGDFLPLGLGAVSGALYLAALIAYGYSIRKSGAVLSSVFSRLGVLVPILLSVCLFGGTALLVPNGRPGPGPAGYCGNKPEIRHKITGKAPHRTAAAGVAAQWLQRQHVENLCSNRQPHRRRLVFILYFCFRRSVYSLSPLPQP